MTRWWELRTRAGSRVRIGALGASVLAAGVCFTVGMSAVGYASEPTDTATPTASPDSVSSPTDTPASEPITTSPTAPPSPTDTRTVGAGPVASTSPVHRGVKQPRVASRSVDRPDAADVAQSAYLVLTADSFDATGLTYAGTFTVPGPSGDVQVLRFTMANGSLAGVSFVQACANGAATVTDAGSASLVSPTFDAVSLEVTVGGTPLTFTVGSPPATPFPSEITLQSITLTATTISADALTMPSFATQVATC